MNQTITLSEIDKYEDIVISKIISQYQVPSSDPLNDRLNAMILLHNNGFLVPEDVKLIQDPEFSRLYKMEMPDIKETAIRYDIRAGDKSKIEVIREILQKPLFGVVTIKADDVIYHGTHYKLIGNIPYPPGYFSKDILQSLGHIMRDFKELTNAYRSFNKVALNKKINDLICIPSIYVYRFVKDTNLLVLTDPHISKTFAKLFVPEILAKYVEQKTNRNEIIAAFIEKMRASLQTNPKFFEGKPLSKIIELYRENCAASCFGGWTNTPGYFLLQSIDYNKYFTEIGLLDGITQVEGLYIPRDQDEIVLFGNINLIIEYMFRSYVLPYSYVNKELSDSAKFIDTFIRSLGEYKQKNTADALIDIARNSYEYNIVRGEDEEDPIYEWKFSWFLTDLKDFNPYLSQSQGYSYKIDINDLEGRYLNNLTIRSSKISVADIDTLSPHLVKFVAAILNKWRNNNFTDVDNLCSNVLPSSRVFIPHL